MRKIFFTLVCFVLVSIIHAQTLFGTASAGGVKGGGTICKLERGTGIITAAFVFDAQDGENPSLAQLVQATDGKLYGLTCYGGMNGYGTLFFYDPATAAFTKLIDFDGDNGANPYNGLIQASDGKLYGMTQSGGSNDAGVIFSYDPATAAYTKHLDFNGTNGAYPTGGLMQASDKLLYGITLKGGSNDSGVIFKFNPATSNFTKLIDFNGSNGKYPHGNLVQAINGKLYGMTSVGGNNALGVLFSYNPATAVFSKLKDLDRIDGSNPDGSLIQASTGKLYGMTRNGGTNDAGVLFYYSPSTNIYKKLRDFRSADGSYPSGNLIQATDGKLYGMTTQGGSNGNNGVLFSYAIGTNAYTSLKDFDSQSGSYPDGSLTQAADGKLYGMTYHDGIGSVGALFSYTITNSLYSNLRDFGINRTGSSLSGGVVRDTISDKLYGMTSKGGSYNKGVIYSFDPFTSNYTKLLDFDFTNGANPYGSLMQAADGKLYGMTSVGGIRGQGVLFVLDPATATYAKLRDFDLSDNKGAFPVSNLVQASDGKLYGMTNGGGSRDEGVIFSYDLITAIYTMLVDFNGSNGSYPNGSMVQASDGNLYGMTWSGGVNSMGILFSYNINTHTFTKLKDFDANSGVNPTGTLLQASNGKLYGMTSNGGRNNFGVLFSYDLPSGSYTKLKEFDSTNGANPVGNLMQASDGKLYGMTYKGGSLDFGVAFCFNPANSNYTKIQDFDGTNGKYPENTFFTEVLPAVTIKINNTSVQEGSSGQKSMTFNVTVSRTSSQQTITVEYKTKDSTAIAPSDYTAQRGKLTFAPGVKKQTISILINGDTQVEGDEKFKVLLGNPVNATIADNTGIGTIINDDNSLTGTPITTEDKSSNPFVSILRCLSKTGQ